MPRQNTNREKPRLLIPLLIVIGGTLFLVASLVIVLGGGVLGEPTPTVHLLSNDQVQRVEVQEAKAAYDSGKAIFLDVRSSDAFAAGHIPGAINIPLGEIEARMSELDPDDWIITY